MRNNCTTINRNIEKTLWNFLFLILLFGTYTLEAQVQVPFTQRTSVYTPTKKIYNIKGDFTMLGNTNLTLVNYGDDILNSNNDMKYVDVDGDSNTWNSSTSELTLSTENGAIPSCSNIIYAGLYWTGRASNGSSSPNVFTVTRNVNGTQPVNNNQTVGHQDNITYSQYSMDVTRQGSSNNYYVRYEFTGNGSTYQFEFLNTAPYIRYRVGTSGGWTNAANQLVANSGNTRTVTFDPITIYSQVGGITLTVNKLERDSRTNRTTSQYESSSFAYTNVTGLAPVTTTESKTFNKRNVSIKGPAASGYTLVTANTNDIYYPTNSDGFMYSAYAEITDYVRTNGLGNYTVADIAVVEGDGGATGYYGGWSIIVVYENSKMKWRDVTIFDGHAYVQGTTASFQLPVSGFNTVQTGAVNMKLGLMAGEGDRGISGDYFEIQKVSDATWMRLNHSGNSTSNFFNSSIQTGGNVRNPNILNNTGLDISMFNIPNPSNSVITNNQTSTTFRYGSTQDTYIIFAAAMAVDAYIPDAEGVSSVVTINGLPAGSGPYTAQPGQEVEFKIKVYNEGTEPINNAKVSIPIPYSASYVAGSASRAVYFSPLPTPNSLTFDNTGNGTINWEIGTLPVPANPTILLGELTFKIKITEDCRILSNPNCTVNSTIFGYMYGVGAVTGIPIDTKPFIQGYSTSGACQGEPITSPLTVNIDAQNYINQNCQNTSNTIAFTFCDSTSPIPLSQISGAFPPGTLFYTQYPQIGTPLQEFPATLGTSTYYAVPPAANGCYFVFTITIIQNPTVVEPIDYQIEGCGIASITGLPFSATPVSITLAQFLAAGGTASNQSISYTITYSDTETGSCPTIVTRTFNISTPCGSPQQLTQIITIDDTIAPVAPAAPADVTVACASLVPTAAVLSANDNCGGSINGVPNDVVTPGSCANSYSIVRTWTFTDACGNSSSVAQNIIVNDNIAPVAPAAPADVTVACASLVPTAAVLSANDNCGGSINGVLNDVVTPGSCANSYSIVRTWTFTDACGNSSSVAQNIIVNDNIAPVAPAAPADVTVACASLVPTAAVLSANDNCGGSINGVPNDVVTPGSCANSYSIVRTWTFTDACGNSSSVAQNIIVNDNVAPVAPAAPADVTVACASLVPTAAVLSANDNCGGSINGVANDVVTPGSCANSYSIVRTWTFTDACGNSSSVAQNIIVNDNVAPVAPAAPADVTVACASLVPTAAVLSANDNCGGSINGVANDVVTPGSCANSYSIVRTWTFTDACGNSSSVAQNIIVNDNVAPVAPAAPADVTVACASLVPTAAVLSANDNCGGSINGVPNDVVTPGSCANSYSIVRTWTFTDACGNSSSVAQNIIVNDNIAPVAPAAPADVTVACATNVPAMISLTAIDNCQGAITVQGIDTTIPGSCANSFVVTRTWTFVDNCGNTSSVSQTINVNDNVAPIPPIPPADITVACSSQVPVMISLTANDNCGGQITAIGLDKIIPGSCPNSYSIVRTWIFIDACGNASTTKQTITVNDTIAPVPPAAPADITVSCPSLVPTAAVLTATDNCGEIVTGVPSDLPTQGSCPNSYSIVRTWTFTDSCGNSSSVSQNILINDNVAPIPPTAPADVTVACSGLVPAMISLTATDNCQSPITVQGVDSITSGNCASSYTITRTWTFTDICGNTSSVTQTINVSDTSSPILPLAPANINVACASDVPAPISLTAVDNCAGDITSVGVDVITPGNCPNSYVITRTWSFGDLCGNTSSISQIITVNDTVAPVAPIAPANVTVSCSSEVPAMISLTASDNCQGQITAQGVDSVTPGDCINSFVIIRTWTFVDACGNSSSVSQTITVDDTIAPVPPAPPVKFDGACSADVPAMISLTAIDNCSGSITVAGVDSTVPGDCPNSFIITRTWTFVDDCGNTSTISQIIEIDDTLAPVAPQAPTDVTVACGAEVPVMISLTATDNCQGDITVQGVDTTVPGNCPNSYTITRTWTFVDACGNTSSINQTINVNDTIAPVVPQAPADITVTCSGLVPAMISLTATDNCQGNITVQGIDSITAGDCASSYTITRTWTFTDECNNTSSVSQTINVSDTSSPILPQAPANVTIACSAEVPAMISLTATDACAGDITSMGVDVITPGNCPNSYVITRTWSFGDLCGNTSSVSQIITVSDIVAPVLPQAPADVTVACGAEVPAMISLTATDNCQGEITVQGVDSIAEGQCINSYVITRTWTFVDACGNTSSVSQIITVSDIVAPVLPQAPADVNVSCGSDVPAMISLTATDNCQGEITVEGVDTITPGQCVSSFIVTRTWTFVDACGNTSSVSQIINVNDTIAPTLPAVPVDITVSCSGEVPPPIWLTAVDNCGGEITVLGEDSATNIAEGTCVNSYIITRTWTFIDACGNTSSIAQIITVNDEIAPILNDEEFQSELTVTCANIPEMPVLNFSDNCGGSVTVESSQVIVNEVMDENGLIVSYDIIRTWTATDTCGNSTVITQTIHVNVDDNFNAGTKELCSNDSANANYNLNQLLNGLVNEDEMDGTWTIENVGFESALQGNILNVTVLPVGYYTLVYNLDTEDSFCPRRYEFYIHVLDDCGVLAECSLNVFNAVSPNQDGLNEVFYIDNITCYAENNVKIYNRWGILVYDESGYNNADIAFNGVSEGRSTLNKGEELPDGTYFYILKYRSNETGNWLDKSGYLYLNR